MANIDISSLFNLLDGFQYVKAEKGLYYCVRATLSKDPKYVWLPFQYCKKLTYGLFS